MRQMQFEVGVLECETLSMSDATQTTDTLFLTVRFLAGLTQRECARMFGISQGMLLRLERGERVKLFEPMTRAIYIAALKEMYNHV